MRMKMEKQRKINKTKNWFLQKINRTVIPLRRTDKTQKKNKHKLPISRKKQDLHIIRRYQGKTLHI